MRKTIIKSLMAFSVFAQVAIAQNAGTIDRFNNDIFGSDSTKLEAYVGQFGGTAPTKSSQATSVSRPMNQDSTNIVPNNITIPVTNTYTAPTVVIPPQNGSCGAANNSIVTSAPTSFLCSIGIPTGVTNNGGSYSWTCSGNNIGNSANVASCSAQQRVVAQCGSDNGKTLSSTPTSLCASGAPSSVSNNGSTYSWSCSGNYGAPASCSASQPVTPTPEHCGVPYINNVHVTAQTGGSYQYWWFQGDINYTTTTYIDFLGFSMAPICHHTTGDYVVAIDLYGLTSDGFYNSYNPIPTNGGAMGQRLQVQVNGLNNIKSKYPNLKIGCPPGWVDTLLFGCWKQS